MARYRWPILSFTAVAFWNLVSAGVVRAASVDCTAARRDHAAGRSAGKAIVVSPGTRLQETAACPRRQLCEDMIEFYSQIKWVHVAAVLASGTIFLLRGLAVQGNARWPMTAPVRYLSYSIDTVLLTTALMLLSIFPRRCLRQRLADGETDLAGRVRRPRYHCMPCRADRMIVLYRSNERHPTNLLRASRRAAWRPLL
jgi:hypothetical protein